MWQRCCVLLSLMLAFMLLVSCEANVPAPGQVVMTIPDAQSYIQPDTHSAPRQPQVSPKQL